MAVSLLPDLPVMALVTPAYSRTKVDAAADCLISEPFDPANPDKWIDALDMVSNWRASHSWPLLSIRLSLTARAMRLSSKALIAQRLKRLPAILSKLKRFSHMKLTQMQDIGGCRAIMPNVSLVEKLDRAYEHAAARRQKHQPERIERYDYVQNPKGDGYRGIHLVYKYHSNLQKYSKHDGLRIELQLRSQLQHEWATAVETVDLFTRQALKSSVGDDAWKRFFLLISAVFAIKEKRPRPVGVPTNISALKEELRSLSRKLKVPGSLSAWSYVIKSMVTRRVPGASTFLLTLNADRNQLSIEQYARDKQKQATDDYLKVEKEILGGSGQQAVLVSVASLQALEQAYPSFYADTTEFLRELEEATGEKL